MHDNINNIIEIIIFASFFLAFLTGILSAIIIDNKKRKQNNNNSNKLLNKEQTMKTIFDKSKISTMAGLYIIRESASKPFKDIGFARTVTFKICYSVRNKTYSLCNILTDGCLIGEYQTIDELIDHLNNDEKGYRPLTKEELLQMLESTNQGFY